jgi:hypothetical protein
MRIHRQRTLRARAPRIVRVLARSTGGADLESSIRQMPRLPDSRHALLPAPRVTSARTPRVLRASRGADAMSLNRMKVVVAGFTAAVALAAPSRASAQVYGSGYDQPSVVVECAPGQRAVMEQHVVGGRTQLAARCVGSSSRAVVYDDSGRAGYRTARARQSTVYVERAPRRTKTKTALTIAGSAATGAGVGGIIKGKKGALIGAAIGGGAASLYDAAKRR